MNDIIGPFLTFGEWLTHDSASAAAWITAVVALAALLAAIRGVQVAHRTYLLGVTPSVEIEAEQKTDVNPPEFRFHVRNRSQYPVIDLRIYLNSYSYTTGRPIRFGNNFSITSDSGREPITLEPGKAFIVEKKTLSSIRTTVNTNPATIWAFTVVFRRKADQKKFIVVEPYRVMSTGIKESNYDTISALHDPSSSHFGDEAMTKQYKEVIDTEKFYYGSDDYS